MILFVLQERGVSGGWSKCLSFWLTNSLVLVLTMVYVTTNQMNLDTY